MKINYWLKFEEGCFYHVYNRGNDGVDLFLSKGNYQFFLQKFDALIAPYFDVLAYCLMPNHFHFLLRLKELNPSILNQISREETRKSYAFIIGEIKYNEFLEDQFKRLFASYALAFNKQHKRKGSLFQKRFKRVGIRDRSTLVYLIAYVHHNPIHHHYRKSYEGWNFSSYQAFLCNKPTKIAKDVVYEQFHNDCNTKAHQSFLKYHIEFKIERQLDQLNLD